MGLSYSQDCNLGRCARRKQLSGQADLKMVYHQYGNVFKGYEYLFIALLNLQGVIEKRKPCRPCDITTLRQVIACPSLLAVAMVLSPHFLQDGGCQRCQHEILQEHQPF